jgi:hypothetical protein
VCITEKDIFNFIYFTTELSIQKYEYIRDNYDMFSEVIGFYSSIKEYTYSTESNSDSPEQNFQELIIIELFEKKLNINKGPTVLRYAADSLLLNKSSVSTFADTEQKYLIRILSSGKGSVMYVFSSSGEQINNFEVTLLPSQKKYPLENNLNPVTIEDETNIEKIQIKLN